MGLTVFPPVIFELFLVPQRIWKYLWDTWRESFFVVVHFEPFYQEIHDSWRHSLDQICLFIRTYPHSPIPALKTHTHTTYHIPHAHAHTIHCTHAHTHTIHCTHAHTHTPLNILSYHHHILPTFIMWTLFRALLRSEQR